jgi:hypothetical protein
VYRLAVNGVEYVTADARFKSTHAFIVLQHGPLQHEIPRLPAPEVLSPLRQITFFVSGLMHRLLGLSNDIRAEERNDLVLVLHR